MDSPALKFLSLSCLSLCLSAQTASNVSTAILGATGTGSAGNAASVTQSNNAAVGIAPSPFVSYSRTLTNQTQFPFNGSNPGQNGDTNFYSNRTPDGHTIGTMGDGTFDGMASAHIITVELKSYNPANIGGSSVVSAVATGVNPTAAWGVPGQNNCMGGLPSLGAFASRPFSIGGTMYTPVACHYDGDPFGTNRVALLRSPNNNKCFCNQANIVGFGGCTLANCSPTGDVITSESMTYNGITSDPVQWPLPDFTFGNPLGVLYTVPWGDDTPTGPVVPPGVDPRVDTTFTYAFGLGTTNNATDPTPVTVHRFKTADCITKGCNDKTIWTHGIGSTGTWDPDFLKSTGMTMYDLNGNPAVIQNAQSIGVKYVSVASRWFMLVSCSTGCNTDGFNRRAFSAAIPTGPWYEMPAPVVGNGGFLGFNGFLDNSFTDLGNGAFKLSNTWNGGGSNYVLGFMEWTYTPAAPVPVMLGTLQADGTCTEHPPHWAPSFSAPINVNAGDKGAVLVPDRPTANCVLK